MNDIPDEADPGASTVARRLRSLPEHDPHNAVENAVLSRLAGNWHRRATVKQEEPNLDDVFELDRPDFPEALLPFREHPTYLALDDGMRDRILAWGWISFNKNIMDIEQHVVNPGFALVTRDVFDTGIDSESMTLAVTQAMVDEQYHTLMHLNASAVTRRKRGWRMPETALPLAYKARRQAHRIATAGTDEERALVSLAFTTVAEISVNAHLDLVAENHEIQPVNRMTAVLHNRDEYCHASIADTLAQEAWRHFSPGSATTSSPHWPTGWRPSPHTTSRPGRGSWTCSVWRGRGDAAGRQQRLRRQAAPPGLQRVAAALPRAGRPGHPPLRLVNGVDPNPLTTTPPKVLTHACPAHRQLRLLHVQPVPVAGEGVRRRPRRRTQRRR